MYGRLETNVHVPVVDNLRATFHRCHDAIRHTRTSSTSSTYRPNYVANSPPGQQLSIPLVSWNVYTSFQKLSESESKHTTSSLTNYNENQRWADMIVDKKKKGKEYLLAYDSHTSNEYSSWNVIYIISKRSNCITSLTYKLQWECISCTYDYYW